MRKIALDVGDKRIGVAVSDELLITAQGITTIERVGIRKDAGKVIDMIREYDCDTVVIGLPRKLDGTNSPQTEKVYEFKIMLENKLRSSGMGQISIVFQDERLTTVMAEKILIEADVRRSKRKEVIDKQAAVLIMQGYLDKLTFEKKQKDELFELALEDDKYIRQYIDANRNLHFPGGGEEATNQIEQIVDLLSDTDNGLYLLAACLVNIIDNQAIQDNIPDWVEEYVGDDAKKQEKLFKYMLLETDIPENDDLVIDYFTEALDAMGVDYDSDALEEILNNLDGDRKKLPKLSSIIEK